LPPRPVNVHIRTLNSAERVTAPGGCFAPGKTMGLSEKACVNCSNVKARKGDLYCALRKQKVSEMYKCGRFKAK